MEGSKVDNNYNKSLDLIMRYLHQTHIIFNTLRLYIIDYKEDTKHRGC